MKQFTYIDVNGHGVLVEDEKTQVELNFLYYEKDNNIPIYSFTEETIPNEYFLNKVVFAEKELNLDVPILPDWRSWEVEKLAFDLGIPSNKVEYFKLGYNHNKKLYSEEDLRKVYMIAWERGRNNESTNISETLESFQKLPNYIVMESEQLNLIDDKWVNNFEASFFSHLVEDTMITPKLFTNSQGKQEGIIKEIIYE